MWTPSILIIIATFAGLLTLWRDEIVDVKEAIPVDETDKERAKRLSDELKKEKTKRLKTISAIFIFLTLLFTLHQVYLSNASANKADFEKLQQHMIDSTRYSNDSIKHLSERNQDNVAYLQLDSTYKNSIENGTAVNNIRKSSESILDSLDNMKTKIEAYSNQQINSLKKITSQSLDLLTQIPDYIIVSWAGEFTVYGFMAEIWNERLRTNEISDKYSKLIFGERFLLDDKFFVGTNLTDRGFIPITKIFVDLNSNRQNVRFAGFCNDSNSLIHNNNFTDNNEEYVDILYDSLTHKVVFQGRAKLKIDEMSNSINSLKSINECDIIFNSLFLEYYADRSRSKINYWILLSNKYYVGGKDIQYDFEAKGYKMHISDLTKVIVK